MLALGIAVASGKCVFNHFDTAQGDVLYLALEDGDWRLQERLEALLGDEEAPNNLHITYNCSPLPLLIQELKGWMADHPETRLVLVDTLAKVRQSVAKSRDAYQADYQAISSLQRFALDHHVGVIGITHLNQKEEVPDILYRVTGTSGVVGSADSILLLERARNTTKAQLHVIGRDVEECVFEMEFDSGVWRVQGEQANRRPGPETTAMVAARSFLHSFLANGPRTADEVKAAALEQGIAESTLNRAKKAEGVKSVKEGNKWVWSLPLSQSTGEGDPWLTPIDHEEMKKTLQEMNS